VLHFEVESVLSHPGLKEVHTYSFTENLNLLEVESIDMSTATALQSISLFLPKLRSLQLPEDAPISIVCIDCSSLEKLPDFTKMSKLEQLYFYKSKMTSFDCSCLRPHTQQFFLSFTKCHNLTQLDSLDTLTQLRSLQLYKTSLSVLDVSGCEKLDSLVLFKCQELSQIKGLQSIKESLRYLRCCSIDKLTGINCSGCDINKLEIQHINADKEHSPKAFSIEDGFSLDVSGFTRLRTINIIECPHFNKVIGLEDN